MIDGSSLVPESTHKLVLETIDGNNDDSPVFRTDTITINVKGAERTVPLEHTIIEVIALKEATLSVPHCVVSDSLKINLR